MWYTETIVSHFQGLPHVGLFNHYATNEFIEMLTALDHNPKMDTAVENKQHFFLLHCNIP